MFFQTFRAATLYTKFLHLILFTAIGLPGFANCRLCTEVSLFQRIYALTIVPYRNVQTIPPDGIKEMRHEAVSFCIPTAPDVFRGDL